MDRISIAKKRFFHIRYLSKMKGKGRSPLQINVKDAITGLIGRFLTIFALILLTKITSAVWLVPAVYWRSVCGTCRYHSHGILLAAILFQHS